VTPGDVRGIKSAVRETIARRGIFPLSAPQYPEGVGLGIGRREDGEHVLVVRATSLEAAEPMAALAPEGERNVRIVTVTKRPTLKQRLQSRIRPLEAGLQIGMAARPFVGTLGGFGRDRVSRRLGIVTNSHVGADEGRATIGHRTGQPFGTTGDLVSVLERHVPLSLVSRNIVDAAFLRVDESIVTAPSLNGAINANLSGTYLGPAEDLLGVEVLKIGRTTEATKGRVTAVEVDGLSVGYDQGLMRFDDQIEVSGGPTSDFSGPGDSGSFVVLRDGRVVALLFAGGRDASGEDFTYANPFREVLDRLDVELAV